MQPGDEIEAGYDEFVDVYVDVCIEYSDKIRPLLSWGEIVSLMVRFIHMTL